MSEESIKTKKGIKFDQQSVNQYTYWRNNTSGKMFKYKAKKGTPNGDVTQIDEKTFFAVQVKEVVKFDLTEFPTSAEIDKITSNAMVKYKEVTERLIDNTRMYEVSHNDIGTTFEAIIAEAKNLNISKKNRISFLGLIQKFFNTKEKLFSRYDTVKNKLDELNNILKTQIQTQYKELEKINELEEVNYLYIKQSKEDLKIISKKLTRCIEIYDSWPDPETHEDIIAIKKAENVIHSLRKREEDTMSFVTLSQQAILKYQSRRETAETAISDSQRVVNYIVPRYIESFLEIITDKGQKKAIDNNKSIKEEWNNITQQNSNNVKENYINGLKSKYSHLTTEETLLKQSSDIIEMLAASKQAHQKGMQESENYLDTLKTINSAIIEINQKNKLH